MIRLEGEFLLKSHVKILKEIEWTCCIFCSDSPVLRPTLWEVPLSHGAESLVAPLPCEQGPVDMTHRIPGWGRFLKTWGELTVDLSYMELTSPWKRLPYLRNPGLSLPGSADRDRSTYCRRYPTHYQYKYISSEGTPLLFSQTVNCTSTCRKSTTELRFWLYTGKVWDASIQHSMRNLSSYLVFCPI